MNRSELGHRHRGDLRGALSHDRAPARVTVELTPEAGASPTAQHLVWMLVNLLARQADEVAVLDLRVPADVPLGVKLSPLVPGGSDLAAALRAGVSAINPAVLTSELIPRASVHVRVGPGPVGKADFNLVSSALGWSGHVGQHPVGTLGTDGNPVGAYVAACLAAGEVFKFVRAVGAEHGEFAQGLWLDAFALGLREAPELGPHLPSDLPTPAFVLPGVGAVGSAFLQVLYALPGLRAMAELVDGDPDGVDLTNLNRYILFGVPHLGSMKASTAAGFFSGTSLRVHGTDTTFEAWRAADPSRPLGLLISGVDKNRARHALQDALPERVLGASTFEMRAQLNLYVPQEGGPCLRCHNPVEDATPDAIIRQRLLAQAPAERAQLAQAQGMAPEVLEEYLMDPAAHCGKVSGDMLRRFDTATGQHEWSVGFVSVLAGTLLAAEYLKLALGKPTLDVDSNRFLFQFWRPEHRRSNRVTGLPAEPGCLCGQPWYRAALDSR